MIRSIRLQVFFLLVSFTSFAKTSASIEEWTTHYTILKENQLIVRENMTITIRDESGYRYAVFQEYYNRFRKVKSVSYVIYDANHKKVKKMTKANALDMSVNASYEIGDARILLIDPEYRNYPFTVELEFEVVYNGFIDFPLWMPRFAPDLEVKKAELILDCYNEFVFDSREVNGMGEPEKNVTEKTSTYRWSVENLQAIKKHISYKSFASEQAKVYLAPTDFSLENKAGKLDTWEGFGKWYYDLNEGRDEIGEQTRQVVDGFKKDHHNNHEEIAKSVYRYMQKKTRYVSIQLGIGGYQTIPSDVVEKTGYGDCKALTNYMMAMLEYAKIPSNPVLVKAGRDVPDILHDFPSNQFNHVFLAVPLKADTLWFECTSQTSPPGHIGTFTDDRYALWVAKDKSQIIKTPTFNELQNVKNTKGVVKLKEEGDARLELSTKQSGMFFDDAMFYQNLTKDRIDRYNYAKFSYTDFTIESFDYKILEGDSAVIQLRYDINVKGLGKPLGTKMILPVNMLPGLESLIELDLDNRKSEIRRSFMVEEQIDVHLPENFRLSVGIEPVKVNSEFGSVELTFSSDDNNVLHISRKAIILKGNYQTEVFEKFNAFLKRVKNLEQSKIVLQSKT
jgi:hypothetical protein